MFARHAGNVKKKGYWLVRANFAHSVQALWNFLVFFRMVVLYSSDTYCTFVVVTLAFYCLPAINILVRLISFVAYLLPYGRNCLTVRCCSKLKQLCNYIHRVFRMSILSSKESIERPGNFSMKNRFLQLFVILSCLLTILSFVLLAMECILFLGEIFNVYYYWYNRKRIQYIEVLIIGFPPWILCT
jgi:hypothetical protein